MQKLHLWIQAKSHALVTSTTAQKAAHTFWQAALSYVIVAVNVQHVPLHTLGDGKVLLVGALGTGLSGLKSVAVQLWATYAYNSTLKS